MAEIALDVPTELNIYITSRDGSDIEFSFEESPSPNVINISINDYLSCPEEVDMIHELSAKGYYTPEQVAELPMEGARSSASIIGQHLSKLNKRELRAMIIAAIDVLAVDEEIPF